MESRKLSTQFMQKGSYHKFITFLLISYAAYFIIFMSHFCFVLE